MRTWRGLGGSGGTEERFEAWEGDMALRSKSAELVWESWGVRARSLLPQGGAGGRISIRLERQRRTVTRGDQYSRDIQRPAAVSSVLRTAQASALPAGTASAASNCSPIWARPAT